ncbi:unnamed protein product [Adineta steineri]|uniref:Uncharacterized protein n=2 Tax=Adineta steineri TaxID=433720 RepID=A0A818WQQ8_9BILA|nr:unnamed protein product [Adineta steineri]CAF3727179.1 unnamed protein product [Adineta steineri]
MVNRRNHTKKNSPTQPTDQSTSSSSSKILHVVRQALLNAAEELISQQENQSIPYETLNVNNNDLNENAKKKKKIVKKKKNNRRK